MLNEFSLILECYNVTVSQPVIYGLFRSARDRIFAWVTLFEYDLKCCCISSVVITPNDHISRILYTLHGHTIHAQISCCVLGPVKHWIFAIAFFTRFWFVIKVGPGTLASLNLGKREPCVFTPAFFVESKSSDFRWNEFNCSCVSSDGSSYDKSIRLFKSINICEKSLFNTVLDQVWLIRYEDGDFIAGIEENDEECGNTHECTGTSTVLILAVWQEQPEGLLVKVKSEHALLTRVQRTMFVKHVCALLTT